MSALPADQRAAPSPQLLIVLSAMAVIALAALLGPPAVRLIPLAAAVAVAAAAYKSLFAWRTLLAGLLIVILFIPIRRYTLPFNLPFQLEPYRIFVLFFVGAWFSSLLIDPRVRIRRSGLEAPLLLFAAAVVASIVLNAGRIQSLGVDSDVIKKLTFLMSFFLVFFAIVSVVQRMDEVTILVKVLVTGGAILGILGIIEARTGYNPFDHLSQLFPFLKLDQTLGIDTRAGKIRAYGSAQHPIAFGAALVLIIPLALYLARSTGRRRWWIATGLIFLGALSSVSRTSVLMFAVVLLVFLWLRPVEVKRLWPAFLVGVVALHFVLPGTIGAFEEYFLPTGGLVQSQQAGTLGNSRGASFGPGLRVVVKNPIAGEGYGTRIVDGPRQNSFTVDDGWLSTAMETGLLGIAALIWLFTRAIRRMARQAKADRSDRGWLLVAITASTAAFAVGMLTFDAFSFIQATLILYVLLALGSVVAATE
jgi:O-antigen ligase